MRVLRSTSFPLSLSNACLRQRPRFLVRPQLLTLA